MRTEIRWAMVALLSIWTSVGLMVAFAPDLINIADDEHVPFTPIIAVIGGAIATVYLWKWLVWQTSRPGHEATARAAPIIALLTAALWAAIAGISVSAPLVLTGTDATRFPLAAMLSVVLGTALTCAATRLVPRIWETARQRESFRAGPG